MPSHCSDDCSYSKTEAHYVKVSNSDYDRIKEALRKMKQEEKREKKRCARLEEQADIEELSDLEKKLKKLKKSLDE